MPTALPDWTPKESLLRMLRGCVHKVQHLEREGLVSSKAASEIREKIEHAILEARRTKWKKPPDESGWRVLSPIPKPKPDTPLPQSHESVMPLPTEPQQHRAYPWWGRWL